MRESKKIEKSFRDGVNNDSRRVKESLERSAKKDAKRSQDFFKN